MEVAVALTTQQVEDMIDALTRAIASGVRTVTTSDGKSVTYGSTREMMSALSALKRRGRSLPSSSLARIKREGS